MTAPACLAVDIEQPAQLIAYLRQRGLLRADETPSCRLLEGGVSNRTVLMSRESPGEAWVLKQALEELRVAADWHSSPLRIHREAAGMRALAELLPPGAVPRFVFEDHEHQLLAMSAVAQPHENWRDELLSGKVDSGLIRQFGGLLAMIHRGSQARKAAYATEFADRSFFETLRLEPYYQYSAESCPVAGEFFASLIAETRASASALVHGDYSPKNVLVRSGRLILLDHEVIHWGDPAFDIGFALSHLLSKANHLSGHRPAFIAAAREFHHAYQEGAKPVDGDVVEARAVRHALGCLLARVVGRSPLGYLTDAARFRQRQSALRLMRSTPAGMQTFIQRFAEELGHGDH